MKWVVLCLSKRYLYKRKLYLLRATGAIVRRETTYQDLSLPYSLVERDWIVRERRQSQIIGELKDVQFKQFNSSHKTDSQKLDTTREGAFK